MHLTVNFKTYLVAAAIGILAVSAPATLSAETTEKTGPRFARVDLVDLATYVADETGKGFTFGAPELRHLSVSLYHPAQVDDAALQAMFLELLAANGLSVEDHGTYWVIGHQGGDETIRSDWAEETPDGFVADFRDAPIAEVSAFVSAATGRQYIVGEKAAFERITVQALTPTSKEDLESLFMAALTFNGFTVKTEKNIVSISRPRPDISVDGASR